MGKGKKGDSQRNRNVKIYQDTLDYLLEIKYQAPEPRPYQFPIPDMLTPEELNEILGSEVAPPEITVVNADTLDEVMRILNSSDNKEELNDKDSIPLSPMILNMASDFKPGGGVEKGSTAQEEVIFRRTSASYTHPKWWYPLENNEAIYSPEILIVKDSNYKLLREENQRSSACIAVPGLRKPRVIDHYDETLKRRVSFYYNDEEREIMRVKIEGIFQVAIKHRHNVLVLGALGCGVFGNPPEEVAKIFKEMINLYGRYFRKISFAILVAKREDQINLDMFKRILLE